MSVSPRISDPKTPEEDAAKRKRSPTPVNIATFVNTVPMVDGIVEVGFRLRAELLRGHEPDEAVQHATELRCDIAKHFAEVWTPEITRREGNGSDFRETIQLINTLFEIAATMATVVVSDDVDEQSKLDVLHQHAIDGLDLIGGSEY